MIASSLKSCHSYSWPIQVQPVLVDGKRQPLLGGETPLTKASAFVLGIVSVFTLLTLNSVANAADAQYCDAYATKAFDAAKAITIGATPSTLA